MVLSPPVHAMYAYVHTIGFKADSTSPDVLGIASRVLPSAYGSRFYMFVSLATQRHYRLFSVDVNRERDLFEGFESWTDEGEDFHITAILAIFLFVIGQGLFREYLFFMNNFAHERGLTVLSRAPSVLGQHVWQIYRTHPMYDFQVSRVSTVLNMICHDFRGLRLVYESSYHEATSLGPVLAFKKMKFIAFIAVLEDEALEVQLPLERAGRALECYGKPTPAEALRALYLWPVDNPGWLIEP